MGHGLKTRYSIRGLTMWKSFRVILIQAAGVQALCYFATLFESLHLKFWDCEVEVKYVNVLIIRHRLKS
jgi:hypothetical protein